jgi:serine/threonine protein kinase
MIGSSVSHYRILEKIGEGGMGEVFLAEDTKLGRQVALKFLPEDLTRDQERKQRFVQEARAAAAIQHPHICAVYEVGEVDGRTFLAMEYIRGQSLREAIASQGLTPQRALELGLQIAEGLAKAHERGVVHRDLKPDNLLISEDGYAKIIDFGLAKLVEPLTPGAGVDPEAETQLKTREGMVMGTVAYMSPEQAVGESLDARSDIFSFGVVLYEMLSGTSPFRRDSATASLRALLNESPPPLELSGTKTPVELQRIFAKSLAKERSERYPSMKELLEDLRALREPSRTLSLSGIVLGAGDATRRKWRWGAVALLVAGLSVVGYWVGKRAPSPPAGVGASGRPSVAVLYFEDHTGDADVGWLVSGVPSMLLTGLAQTPGLDVISNQRIHEVLKELGGEASTPSTRALWGTSHAARGRERS